TYSRADNHPCPFDSRLDDGERLMARPIHAGHNLTDRHVRTRLQIEPCNIKRVIPSVREKKCPLKRVKNITTPLEQWIGWDQDAKTQLRRVNNLVGHLSCAAIF